MRKIILLLAFFYSCSSGDVESGDINDEDNEEKVESFKKIVSDNYDVDKFKLGATLNFYQLNSNVQQLFLKEFNYTTAENSFKQTIVHPDPDTWNWERVDAFINFANTHNIEMRVHGPVGPQSSVWAKDDARTIEELSKNYQEFLVELCKRINNQKNIKWMDVVNETIASNGQWTDKKEGTDKWENPWTQIGKNDDGIPNYIIKSFEIADQYAPNVSLVFNQHAGMQPVMWDRVKETILYLKNKGLRVDGLGWQSHLRDNVVLSLNKEKLDYLLSLIDWAHQNELDFHITEIDYRLVGNSPNATNFNRQAQGYTNILKSLIAKRSSGVVTFNTWGIYDKNNISSHEFKYLYDSNLNPKKAVDEMKIALKNKNSTMKYLD